LPIALVVEYETDAQQEQAQPELARSGFDRVVGFVTADDLDETQQITQVKPPDFLASLKKPQQPVILDVRSALEWSQDHLDDAINIPLPELLRRIGELSREAHLTVPEPMRTYCRNLTEETIRSGHWLAQEKPVEVNAALVKWLAMTVPDVWPK
jgi:rhodanese-related sulfurtransferase